MKSETIEHDMIVHEKEEDKILIRNLPRLSRSMTFASMMKSMTINKAIFKNFSWLFPPLCRRKDHRDLTETEKARYICAFNMVNTDGTLGDLVEIHNQLHNQHINSRLLPWHRVFLYLFEEALHHYHPDVCIPYWDWAKPEEQHFPDWLASELPTVVTPTRTISVVRAPGSDSQLAGNVSSVGTAMAQTNYNSFTSFINPIHGSVHLWVGGTMGTYDSPADPVFWLHHCNLDRLWWEWYNSVQGNHQNPSLTGADAVMDPWSYTEIDTRNIAKLGYEYV